MLLLSILAENVDPAAALLDDGELVAVGEQERFSRNKHAYGEFPIDAVEFCLQKGETSLDQVDKILYGWDGRKYPLQMAETYLDGWNEHDKDQRTLEWEKENLRTKRPSALRERIQERLRDRFSTDIPPVEFEEHHRAHAASVASCSGFDDAAVLTADGHGEEKALVGWDYAEGELTELFSMEIPNSLGWFFASVTAFLGFRANNGEGKVMGLAPYGERNAEIEAVFDDILEVNDNGYQLDPSYVFYGDHTFHERFTDKLVSRLGQPRERGEDIEPFHENVAFAAQRKLQQALAVCVNRLLDASDRDRLCLAGGVFYNCKANMHIRELFDLDGYFVQPWSGETGIPFGSALAEAEEPLSEPLSHVYYGYEPDERELNDAIEEADVTVITEGRRSVRSEIVERLLNGHIVARYSGRTEVGPRALGNRSILADPRDRENLYAVNEVKRREEWRPFAPTILADHADEVLEGEPTDPFMIQTYRVAEEWVDDVEAVVHVDHTTRPQILERDTNPDYWELIDEFRSKSGVPALLNTSFNLSGDPIVNTPLQALETFRESKIDYLQLGEFLVTD